MGRHFSRRRLLELLLVREPTRHDLDEILEHHFAACPTCKEELEGLARVSGTALGGRFEPPGTPLSRSQQATWRRFRMTAETECAELLALPANRRRLKITHAHTRFKNPLLADRLIDESRKRASGDPADAYDLAECAQTIALRLSEKEVPHAIAMTCLARANAYRANALRVSGSLKQAETILEGAVALFDAEGTGDPLVHGDLMELSASVARDQRKLVEAEAFLAIAQGVYKECTETELLCRVLVVKGTVCFETGDIAGALTATMEALTGIERDGNPWLYLCAVHNVANYLVELERFDQARDAVARHRDLYERFEDNAINLRRIWIEGRIERMEGNFRLAEEKFAEVKAGFLERGVGYDAALVSLDLALLYVEQGRTQEVKRVAEAMVEVFMAEDIHREALAAVRLFQEAARQEAVTVTMLAELIAYLKRVRTASRELPV